MTSTVRNGRLNARARGLCEGCNARRQIGEPKPNDMWAQRLELTREQVDLLLLAAKEYEELCEESGTISNAVEAIDWLAVDALRVELHHQYRNAVRFVTTRRAS